MPPKRLVALLLVGLGLGGYFCAYYGTVVSEWTLDPAHPVSRSAVLANLLTLDDQVRSWFGTPLQCSLLDRVPVLLVAAGILAAAVSLGWLALVALRINARLSRLENFVFAAAVGLSLVSSYVLVVGLLGGLSQRWLFVVPGLGAIAAAAWLGWRGKAANSAVPNSTQESVSLSSRCGMLAIPFVAVILLGSLLPPFEFDVREYHLQVPKEFFQQGQITFLPHNVYGNMPMGAEMLSLLGMVLVRDWWLGALVGKTLTASFVPLTALGLWTAGRRLVSPTAGLVAAVAYVSIPWMIQVSTLGLIDGVVACYLFLAVYAALLSAPGHSAPGHSERSEESGPGGGPEILRYAQDDKHQTRRGKEDCPTRLDLGGLLLAGYLAGGAVSIKYPAVLFVVIPLTVWLGWQYARPRWTACGKPLLAFGLAVVAGCGLWLAKNAVLTGNPTYPLLYEVFDGKTWTPEKNAQWNRVHRPHDFSGKTLGEDLARVGLTSPWLSPLLMPLAVLGLVPSRHRRLALLLLGYFAYMIAVWWLFTHRIDRFWIPIMPVLALLAGLGAEWSASVAWRRVLVGVLVLGCLSNFGMVTCGAFGDNRYFVRLAQLRDDPLRVEPWHRFFNNQPPQGRLLLVGEAQVFDLRPPILYNTCFDTSIFEELVKGRSPEEVRQALVEQKISDLYVDWGEIARYRRSYGFTDFVQPEVFQRLVEAGVLKPLPDLPDSSGQGYRVVVR